MKNVFIGLVLAGAAAGACTSPPHPAVRESAPAAVTVGRVSMAELVSQFEAGGVVRARATALIASRVMAPVTEIRVRPGDRVRRGATLVTLDAQDMQANKGRAEASSLSAAESARAAAADASAAESSLVLARATHERMAALHAKRSATTQELDQAVAALAAAEAQRTSAQARLAAANAARDAAAAAAAAATVTATYAELLAPFDGIVAERHTDPGSMATPGIPLLTVEDPTTYRLEVQIDEARAAFVAVGQAAPVRLDNPSDRDGWISGRVAEIARVDPASHAFLVKIGLPASSTLRSGLFGRARLSGSAQRAISVPTSALVTRGQLTFVYLVDADSRVHLRLVSIGSSAHERAEVLAGLREGDAIVISPPTSLNDATRVRGDRP